VSVRASVVVAVYNTGEHIEPLIESLRRQTLPAEEFEVIFVDDGSTDETPARLDRLADDVPNVVVRHIPNSGWPGRPRNVGIDVAQGRYVFFADHDDWFGLEALQRMTDYADEHGADVLIGRYAGHRRGVAKAMFGRNQPQATLANTPLMDSLTPHKLFRRQFLLDEKLRFPEGRRRLEDHVFVVDSYFRARRIAVLADYHCYFHVGRPDAGNAAYERIDPPSYYGYVREVIDVILSHTEPGPLRDRCLRRPWRQEMLGRLDGPGFLKAPPEYQRSVFAECRALAEQTLPVDLDAGLSPPQRLRAALVRQGRFDDLVAYVEHQVRIGADIRLEDLTWAADGTLGIELSGSLHDGRAGHRLTYPREGADLLLPVPALDPPVRLTVQDGTSAVRAGAVRIFALRTENSEEWPIRTESELELHDDGDGASVTYRGRARFDPRTLAGGTLLTPGAWEFWAAISQTGWAKTVRLGPARSARAVEGCTPTVLSGVPMKPAFPNPHGQLTLVVGGDATPVRPVPPGPARLSAAVRARVARSRAAPLLRRVRARARGLARMLQDGRGRRLRPKGQP
jgi:poly(ribitol-phosphate) beta-N-acetylglucosaminyltransferase